MIFRFKGGLQKQEWWGKGRAFGVGKAVHLLLGGDIRGLWGFWRFWVEFWRFWVEVEVERVASTLTYFQIRLLQSLISANKGFFTNNEIPLI